MATTFEKARCPVSKPWPDIRPSRTKEKAGNPEIAAPDSPDREQHISSHNDPEPDIDDRSSFGKRRKG
jgi:hypothetical protein